MNQSDQRNISMMMDEYSGLRDTTVRFLGNRRSSKLETSNPAMETKSMTP